MLISPVEDAAVLLVNLKKSPIIKIDPSGDSSLLLRAQQCAVHLGLGAGGSRPRLLAASEVELVKPIPLLMTTTMSRAIGFGIVIVIFAVLMPQVFRALETFLLAFLEKAAQFLSALQVPPQ